MSRLDWLELSWLVLLMAMPNVALRYGDEGLPAWVYTLDLVTVVLFAGVSLHCIYVGVFNPERRSRYEHAKLQRKHRRASNV